MIVTCLSDPLCGWCYGACRALALVVSHDGNRRLLPSGPLFGGLETLARQLKAA